VCRAVRFGPDVDGVNGLLLSKDLPKHAGRVLERCVRKVAPRILTLGQKAGECNNHMWQSAAAAGCMAHC